MDQGPLSLFACFLCRHVKKNFSYPTRVSCLKTGQGFQRYGDSKYMGRGFRDMVTQKLNGTVWLAKGWAVHGDSLQHSNYNTVF